MREFYTSQPREPATGQYFNFLKEHAQREWGSESTKKNYKLLHEDELFSNHYSLKV